jgi:hypothetical protein
MLARYNIAAGSPRGKPSRVRLDLDLPPEASRSRPRGAPSPPVEALRDLVPDAPPAVGALC